jgi:hypothetical protein
LSKPQHLTGSTEFRDVGARGLTLEALFLVHRNVGIVAGTVGAAGPLAASSTAAWQVTQESAAAALPGTIHGFEGNTT